MLYFRVPFASYEYVVLSPDLAPLVTVITVVVLANAINLIDGLDGLAAGIVLIAGRRDVPLRRPAVQGRLARGLEHRARSSRRSPSGICVGFLPHNFNPARIFMGDAGAMFLGLLLATTTITIGGTDDRPVQRPDLLLLRAAAHPARDPRRADRRHRVLVRPARGASASRSRRPTRSTCTTG